MKDINEYPYFLGIKGFSDSTRYGAYGTPDGSLLWTGIIFTSFLLPQPALIVGAKTLHTNLKGNFLKIFDIKQSMLYLLIAFVNLSCQNFLK